MPEGLDQWPIRPNRSNPERAAIEGEGREMEDDMSFETLRDGVALLALEDMQEDADLMRAVEKFEQLGLLSRDKKMCRELLRSIGYQEKYDLHEVAALAKALMQ